MCKIGSPETYFSNILSLCTARTFDNKYTSARFNTPLYPSVYAFIQVLRSPQVAHFQTCSSLQKKIETGEALQRLLENITSSCTQGTVLVDLAWRLAIEQKNIELNAVTSSHQQRSYYAKLFKLSCKPQMCELTNICAHVDTVGGKCPTWTWPNYWGYNLQQILESDVQNPQKKTVTNPLRHAPNQPPTRSLRCMYFPLPTPLTTSQHP